MATAHIEARGNGTLKIPCPKCSCTVSRTEEDAVGSIRTCARCGHCTYLDREGKNIEEQGELNSTTHNTTETNPESNPETNPESNPETIPEKTRSAEVLNTAIPEEIQTGMREGEHPEMAGGSQVQDETAGMEPSGQEPEEMEPSGQEPEEMEPSGQERDETEPEEMEPEEMEPAGGGSDVMCPDCGASLDDSSIRRFRRMQLLQCPECRHWNINPEVGGSLDTKDKAIGAVIQANLEGTAGRSMNEEMERLTPEIKAIQQNVPRWIHRYIPPAAAVMKKMWTPTSSPTWEIDAIPLQVRRKTWWFWSITDQMTQYILATGRTGTERMDDALMDQAELISGEMPAAIILGHPNAEKISGLIRYVNQKTDIMSYQKGEENPDSSMVRFREAIQQRFKASVGKMSIESADVVLNQLSLSINLFEECPDTGTTPAENAGLKSPYRDWTDLVVIESNNPPPEESKTGRRPARQQAEKAAAKDEIKPEREADAEAAAAPSGADPAAGTGTGKPDSRSEPEPGNDEHASGNETNQNEETGEPETGEPRAAAFAAENGEITLRELLERLGQQEEEAYRKYLEIVQTREKVEEVIEFLEQEENLAAA